LTLASYQTLKKKDILHQYEAEDEPVRPIMDHELAAAIDSLQTSAAAIEKQCKILEAQKDALMKLKALDKPNLDVEHERNERRRKELQEKARLDVSVCCLGRLKFDVLTVLGQRCVYHNQRTAR
jgi:hypothetical protein